MWDALQQLLRAAKRPKYEPVADTEMVASQCVTSMPSRAVLSVQGMTCAACSSAVEAALRAVPGVTGAQVALLQHSAEVEYDAAATCTDDLVSAVDDAGFDCKLLSVHNVDGGDAAGGEQRPQVARLAVLGMTCAACSGAVERGLLALPGVTHAAVALTQGEAEVTYNPSAVDAQALVDAVDDLGFEARLISRAGLESCSLGVCGMTCSACSASVESALRAVPGVSSASVCAVSGRAEVWFNPRSTGPRAFLDAAGAAGFEASLLAADGGKAADHRGELQAWRDLLSMALVFTIPVFSLAMLMPMVPGTQAVLSAPVLGFRADELLKWALATPVQFWVGWRFHRGAWKALRRGVANMDVLVALGTDASYFYSVISIMHHRLHRHDQEHYTPTDFFETCAMLITVVVLGKYLECSAKHRTSDAIQALLALVPESATLVQLDDEGRVVSEETVHTSLIHHGDLLKVLPGGRIPADGELLIGSSCINESMITGESEPVLRGKGDPLIGGTINAGNALVMRATRVGADTVLSQIVRLVQRAQLAKAPIQAYADRVASFFVPAVVALAVATWAAWYVAGRCGAFPDSWLPMGHTHFLFALLFGIAVLVIACPCALGLATPTAVMVGTGVGAQLGILIKGGDALERGHYVDTVIFDKTGTVTRGKPQVTEARLFEEQYTLHQVCQLAAAAEAASEHPLARAVLEFAEEQLSRPPSGKPTAGGASPSPLPQPPLSPGGGAVPAAVFSLEEDCGAEPGGRHALRRFHGSGDASSWSSDGQLHGRCSWDGLSARPGKHPPGSHSGGARAAAWHGADGSGAGCTVSTPTRLGRLLSTGVFKVSEVQNHPGKGVTAHLPDPHAPAGKDDAGAVHIVADSSGEQRQHPAADGSGLWVALGNRLLMQEQGVQLSAEVEEYMQGREAGGQTCVLVAINRRPVAALAISDPLKPEAAGVVAALQRQGFQCHLVTGDNQRTARAIARQLGVQHVRAEVLPAGKVAAVRELQHAGRVVAMVGDGINDSPALAAADVGMAVGSGTDIAVEAADYVLMRDDLEQVLVALDLSRKTFSRIRWNFFWAMTYNVVMVPIAAGALYPSMHVQMPPWLAGGCMVLSSVSVVLSSLMLRRYRPPPRVSRRDSSD